MSQPLTGPPGLLDRLRPCPVQVQELGAVDQAPAGEGDHVGLVGAPGRQRLGPLAGPPPLQDFLAALQHRAVDRAHHHRGELTGDHRHHGLVEGGHGLVHPAQPDQGAALDLQPERDQVVVASVPADPGRPRRQLPRGRGVAGHDVLDREREQQQAALGAVGRLMLQEPVGPGQPTAGLRQLPRAAQVERQPERAPGGPPGIAGLGMQLLGALQRPQAILHLAQEVGRGRQQLQILCRQDEDWSASESAAYASVHASRPAASRPSASSPSPPTVLASRLASVLDLGSVARAGHVSPGVGPPASIRQHSGSLVGFDP
jgi:hypothetical protein